MRSIRKSEVQTAADIARQAAVNYAGSSWYYLSARESALILMLEKGGFLEPRAPGSKSVGRAIQ